MNDKKSFSKALERFTEKGEFRSFTIYNNKTEMVIAGYSEVVNFVAENDDNSLTLKDIKEKIEELSASADVPKYKRIVSYPRLPVKYKSALFYLCSEIYIECLLQSRQIDVNSYHLENEEVDETDQEDEDNQYNPPVKYTWSYWLLEMEYWISAVHNKKMLCKNDTPLTDQFYVAYSSCGLPTQGFLLYPAICQGRLANW